MRKAMLLALRWLTLLAIGAALGFTVLVLALGVPTLSGMVAFKVAVFWLVIGAFLAFIGRRVWRWHPARS